MIPICWFMNGHQIQIFFYWNCLPSSLLFRFFYYIRDRFEIEGKYLPIQLSQATLQPLPPTTAANRINDITRNVMNLKGHQSKNQPRKNYAPARGMNEELISFSILPWFDVYLSLALFLSFARGRINVFHPIFGVKLVVENSINNKILRHRCVTREKGWLIILL